MMTIYLEVGFLDKSKLISMVDKIEPDLKLIESTKNKLKKKKKRKSAIYYVLPAAIFMVIAGVGIYGDIFKGSLDVSGDFYIDNNYGNIPEVIMKRSIPYNESYEDIKGVFLSQLKEDEKPLIVKGNIVSETRYKCKDIKKYGIEGFDVLNIKVSEVIYGKENIDNNINTITAIDYDLNLENELDGTYYLYSKSDNNPNHEIFKSLGIHDDWIIYK